MLSDMKITAAFGKKMQYQKDTDKRDDRHKTEYWTLDIDII